MEPADVVIHTENITLDQFLKWSALAFSGGEAKQLIQKGQVMVNGCRETRRSRRLVAGDVVSVEGLSFFRVVVA